MPRHRPEPYARYTTPEFWNDPHISARMLAAHLDPDSPMASRTSDVVAASVAWIATEFDVAAGVRVLDLGCGPGLYANALARHGATVLGIDVSRRSLAHARAVADAEGLAAEYREGSYLTTDLGAGHDLALLIFEDYCALSPDQRALLLGRTREALRPGGGLVLDVTAAPRFAEYADDVVAERNLYGGFFAPEPYDGVRETWTYPDLRLVLERFIIDAGNGRREYWNWMQCLTPDETAAELDAAGFGPPRLYADLTGAAFDPAADSFAVVTRT